MSLPAKIVYSCLAMIFVASIWFGGRDGKLKETSAAEWAWAIILIQVVIAEILLIVLVDHTLSNQAQFWVRFAPAHGFLVAFLLWLVGTVRRLLP